MGDKTALAKARMELEDLYSGVPDDSVNLTFQDLAEIRQHKKKLSPSQTMETVSESSPKKSEKMLTPLTKLPSLDFTKGLEASFQGSNNPHNYHHTQNHNDIHPLNPHNNWPEEKVMRSPLGHVYGQDHHKAVSPRHQHRQQHGNSPRRHMHMEERSMAFDDMSIIMSGVSVAYGKERGGKRRPGIPHSNICTICCNYIYIFRHRCLVCGRVYCRQCVNVGMGDMPEGRKCIECLGRRFSQRYIQKAGNLGWCMGYPSVLKQLELKWAEKGPRRSGERRYDQSGMVSRSRSPITMPTTPTRQHHSPMASNTPSFVATSPYNSPYASASHHHLPF